MKVIIISTNRHRHPMPVMPLGACIVAEAAQAAGHRVKLLDSMFCDNPVGVLKTELRATKPDIVGLSIRNIDNNDMQNPVEFFSDLIPLVDIIRKNSQAPIVPGGSAIAVMPEELLRYTKTTWAVLGDGEVVFPRLLDAFITGDDPNLIPGIASLEDNVFRKNLPIASRSLADDIFPDFHHWLDVDTYLSYLSTIPVQSKRGCPYKCIYCTYSISEGNNYRLCTPESVVEAIKKLALAGIRDIEFVDNVFNSPYEHAIAICEGLAKARLNVRLHSLELNPRFVDDDLLTVMQKAGFTDIGITVESAADVVLERLGKGYVAEDAHKAAQSVKRHNLPFLWIFMLGAPGETEATVKETFCFAKHYIRPKDIAFFNMGIRVYPNTKLEQLARREGVLAAASKEMLWPVFYFSPTLDLKWLVKELHDAMDIHLNDVGPDSISLGFLPLINRFGYSLGLKPHLWRYTPFIRRGLKLLGVNT